jgi:hypothetical protein
MASVPTRFGFMMVTLMCLAAGPGYQPGAHGDSPFAVGAGYVRSERKPARISSDRNAGCSQAAKCPPLGSLL